MVNILIVEDDSETAAYTAKGLREEGHRVETAGNGRDGLEIALGGGFDVLVVDRMMPEMDGLTLVREFRAAGGRTPVLFLTALGSVGNRVKGLDAGADDYLVKPFAFAELRARIEALARRRAATPPETDIAIGDLEIRRLERRVYRGGKPLPVPLKPKEFRLLEVLAEHAGRVVTRTMLLEEVWDLGFDPGTNVIDAQISRLRAKIDKGFDRPLLHTVRGVGYRLAPD
ncbi:MAG: response regulator transcription factor [Alphaproteobacteria bacterium]|nr:response regulator transcription factor [Alphaproteobacteria bacterium]